MIIARSRISFDQYNRWALIFTRGVLAVGMCAYEVCQKLSKLLKSPVKLTDKQSALVSYHVWVKFDGGSTPSSADGALASQWGYSGYSEVSSGLSMFCWVICNRRCRQQLFSFLSSAANQKCVDVRNRIFLLHRSIPTVLFSSMYLCTFYRMTTPSAAREELAVEDGLRKSWVRHANRMFRPSGLWFRSSHSDVGLQWFVFCLQTVTYTVWTSFISDAWGR